jgi:hypothetical protein
MRMKKRPGRALGSLVRHGPAEIPQPRHMAEKRAVAEYHLGCLKERFA